MGPIEGLLSQLPPILIVIVFLAITPLGLQALRLLFEKRIYECSFGSMADALFAVYAALISLEFHLGARKLWPEWSSYLILFVCCIGVGIIIYFSQREWQTPAARWGRSPANILHFIVLVAYPYMIISTVDIVIPQLLINPLLSLGALCCLALWLTGFWMDSQMGNLDYPNIQDPERDIYTHIWAWLKEAF